VGAVYRREKKMRRKRNRDGNWWGGGSGEVNQNKLQPAKKLGPQIKFTSLA
jgi:hypothetical protein